jgi:phage gpG-like protein
MIRGTVVGGEQAVARFTSMPEKLRVELRIAVQRAAFLVQRHSKADKLSGQVLHVRTGRLRRSIHYRITEAVERVTGIVGTNVSYAKPHEYGFTGTVGVREHLRRSTVYAKVRGSALFDPQTGKMHLGRARIVELLGAEHTVRAHMRHMHMPERSFLRSALADEREAIKLEFQNAARRALEP